MALVIHQLQGSFYTAPSKSLSWGNGIKRGRNEVSLQVGLANVRSFNKCSLRLSGTARCFVARRKLPQISAFNSNARKEGSDSRASSSKPADHSVKLSYLPQTNEETPVQSLNAQNAPLSYACIAKDSVVKSTIVQKLYKKWLKILVSQPPNGSAEGFLEGHTATVIPEKGEREIQNVEQEGRGEIQVVEQENGRGEIQIVEQENGRSETQNVQLENGRREIIKVVWSYFLGLDATIKLPLIIFTPFYLVVNVAYGTKVARQLAPLWIVGPLIVVLYVLLARRIIALYIFTFKMTIIFLKSSPSYLQAAASFIARGGIQAVIYACFFKPLVDIKNADYSQLMKHKQKQFKEWSNEKFLDFAEAIWPFYCRTIRFLKRANLI